MLWGRRGGLRRLAAGQVRPPPAAGAPTRPHSSQWRPSPLPPSSPPPPRRPGRPLPARPQTGMSPLARAAISNQTIQESMRLVMMVRAFQVRTRGANSGTANGPVCVCASLWNAARRQPAPPPRSPRARAPWTPGHCHAPQVNGHFATTLDPLGLDVRVPHPELDPASYGFTEADMDRE